MRDNRIDFLRFFGFALIILAHVLPPMAILTLRGFDVPLMVIISGVSYSLSSQSESFFPYLLKRFRRLVLPTWMFLFLFFMLFWIIGVEFTFDKILTSFTLTSGIGFVWVIRVFFIVAIFAPVINRLNMNVESNWTYLIYVLIAIIVNEIFVQTMMHFYADGVINMFMKNFWDGVTYSLIFAIGLRFNKFTRKQFTAIMLMSIFIFVAYGSFYYSQTGQLASLLSYKYPPTLYFLSYGLIGSIASWEGSRHIVRFKFILPLTTFLGQNTLWIYFWHISFLRLIGRPTHNFLIDFMIIFGASSAAYYLQYLIINKFIFPRISSNSIKKNIRMLFIG